MQFSHPQITWQGHSSKTIHVNIVHKLSQNEFIINKTAKYLFLAILHASRAAVTKDFFSLMKSDITSREFIPFSILSETLNKTETAARRKSQIQAQTETERKQRRGKDFKCRKFFNIFKILFRRNTMKQEKEEKSSCTRKRKRRFQNWKRAKLEAEKLKKRKDGAGTELFMVKIEIKEDSQFSENIKLNSYKSKS